MNAVAAAPAGLEGGSGTPSSADPDGPSARAEGQLLPEGDDHRDDAIVVWNGMVARFSLREDDASGRQVR